MSMELTKRLWEQPTDKGVLAYHIIQSFSPGEATPDQVHEIGCEFARRFLADRFECTVSTHLDKGHLHNHIVVNSVSYADGKMFRNNFDTYYHGIRQVSDELCRENRLSVIETDGKGKSYDEWLSGQAGKPTIRGMVRKDVEQAIAAADSFDGFITELQNMGYTVKYGPRVEHMAVRHKDAQRNIRIDRLDPRFSETALREYYRQLHRMPTEMQQEYRQENAPTKPKWQPTELLMRSEDPVIDRKYNLLKHPNVKYTPDAGGEPYVIPPDYMGDAVTITMDAVAAATAPEITEEMYEQLDYLEKHPEENYYENEENFSQYDQGD